MNPISSYSVRIDGLVNDQLNGLGCDPNLNKVLELLLIKLQNVEGVFSNVDISCLDPYMCKKTGKEVLQLLIDRMCTLQNLDQDCQSSSNCCAVSEYDLTLLNRWTSGNPTQPKAYLNNGWVKLSGKIGGGSTLMPIIQLPSQVTPTEERRLPFAFSFSLPNINNETPFLKITTAGIIELVWSGSTPASTLTGSIYLDGLSYKL